MLKQIIHFMRNYLHESVNRKQLTTFAERMNRFSGQPVAPEVGQLSVHVRRSCVADGIVMSQHGKHKLTTEHVAQQVRQVLHSCQLLLRGQSCRVGQAVPVT